MIAELVPLIAKYGYAATFVGTLLEGETFLVLSGLAAHQGYLRLPLLFAVGAAGAFITDNVFFAMGRAFGPALLRRFPDFAPSVARAHALVARWPNTAVIGVRFLYGMRSVGPAVIGAGSMTWSRFVVLDALAASVWSSCWVSAGYAIGEGVEQLLGTVTQIGRWSSVCVGVGIVLALILYSRRRRASAAPDPKTSGPDPRQPP